MTPSSVRFEFVVVRFSAEAALDGGPAFGFDQFVAFSCVPYKLRDALSALTKPSPSSRLTFFKHGGPFGWFGHASLVRIVVGLVAPKVLRILYQLLSLVHACF